jgi:uncharacterized membrane protein
VSLPKKYRGIRRAVIKRVGWYISEILWRSCKKASRIQYG